VSPDPGAWGIEPGYHDVAGRWRPASPDTVDAVLAAMGADTDAPPGTGDDSRVWVVPAGQPVAAEGRWELTTEQGQRLEVEGSIADLPTGYHRLVGLADGRRVTLVVTPGRCHLPDGLRTWGWAAQLPGVRSEASWGIGDLADLRRLNDWSAQRGAGFTLLNPLHAPLPGLPQEPSPYFASSRSYRNPIYLRVEDVPGAAGSPLLEQAARAGRDLNRSRLVRRDEVWRLKVAVLEDAWERFASAPERRHFESWCAAAGPTLRRYAIFCVLNEIEGRGWRSWPEALRRADSAEVAAVGERSGARVGFHMWLQWLVDRQMAEAATVGLVQDLAIGADPAGADAWLWQDCFALDARVGAPPDDFNASGQDWGFPPLDPWRLRQAGFEPFAAVVRSALAHAAGLRIDHVAGLFRLFWIPEGADPSEGVYVRYPWAELLGVLSLESQRAAAWVVGEDLGTVEPFVRDELQRRRILSTRLLWFEPEPPASYPTASLAAVTTHDLPTVAGLWSGSDAAEQEMLGLDPQAESIAAIRQRVQDWTGLPPDTALGDVVEATYRLLSDAPSVAVVVTLEDAVASHERPNLPGTTDERPNWSLALPVTLDELVADPLANRVADAASAGRGQP